MRSWCGGHGGDSSGLGVLAEPKPDSSCFNFKASTRRLYAHLFKLQGERSYSGVHEHGIRSARAEEPRWLNDEEQRIWRSYVHATTLLEDHLDRQLQRDAGMPHIYYGLLVKLAEAPHRRLRMTELAM